jgi:hypothetical protein
MFFAFLDKGFRRKFHFIGKKKKEPEGPKQSSG